MSTAQIASTVGRRSAASRRQSSGRVRTNTRSASASGGPAYFSQDLENLNITFMNKQGKLLSIPLVSVATIRQTTALTNIQRKDQKRVITITADAQGRFSSEVLGRRSAAARRF